MMGLFPELVAMMRRPTFRSGCPAATSALGLAIAVSLSACGGAPDDSPSPPSPASSARGEQAFGGQILLEEIVRRGSTDATAYDLIQRLRPAWLLTRGQNSFTNPAAAYPVVYLDAIRYGGLMTLHQVTTNTIQRVEFIGTADATIRWGTGHQSGVINVVTGR